MCLFVGEGNQIVHSTNGDDRGQCVKEVTFVVEKMLLLVMICCSSRRLREWMNEWPRTLIVTRGPALQSVSPPPAFTTSCPTFFYRSGSWNLTQLTALFFALQVSLRPVRRRRSAAREFDLQFTTIKNAIFRASRVCAFELLHYLWL